MQTDISLTFDMEQHELIGAFWKGFAIETL